MGRPGLSNHRKFKRLARDLGNPCLARGVLELIWDTCYEAGDAFLGDEYDVASAAQWQGDPDILVKALWSAGGEGRSGFIDDCPDEPGQYECHNLWDHAPDYVRRRYEREQARKAKGITLREQKVAAGIASGVSRRTDVQHMATDDEQMTNRCSTDGNNCPADDTTPSPSPSPSTTPTPSAPLPGLDLVLQKPLSRKEKKKQKLGTFRADTIALIEYLFRKWPTERLGKRIPNDAIKACENVEWIIDTFSDVTIETLRACADGWLTLEHECPNAIQFFFGTGPHAPWRAEVKGLNLPE